MIELRTLGALDLKAADGNPVHSILAQPKRLALLAYLAVHAAGARRDSVVALFWPELDTAHARGALRQSLRFLRRELGDGILNGHGDEEVGFEPATLWFDALAFQQACDAGEPARALQLYRGDFLAGFFVNDGSAELERWIEGERLRLRRLAARAAAEVAQRAERDGDLAAATSAARQAVAFDLDDEPALARLIELLVGSGARPTSVTILPLSNATRDTTLTYLTAGMAEGVTAALSRVPGLRVADRAGDVLAWTLRRVGDSLSLAVDLRRGAAGARRWSREFPLSASGALAVEGRVVGDVVRQLRPRAADSIELLQLHRTTTSPDAYLLYLQGRYFLGRRSSESLARARGLFAQAIERDPVYAAAYAGLGYSYVALAYYWVMPSREAYPLAEAAARRALQIDSTLGFAHALVAEATASFHRRWAAAEPLFRRALELDPDDPEPHQMFGVYLRTLGHFDEAEAEMRRAVELDPLTRHFSYQLGRVLACAGRPADAAAEFAKQLALDSIYPPAHYELAKALASQGDYDAAINEFATGARQWGDTAYGRLIHGNRGSAGYTAARLLGATRSLERLRPRAKPGIVPPGARRRAC